MKNLKINKRALSILAALMIGATPMAAGASEIHDEKSNNQVGFVLVKKAKDEKIMTKEEFIEGIANAYNLITKYISYGNTDADREALVHDLQCLYYLVNRSYIKEDVEEYLINEGYVYETYCNDMNGLQNFMEANRLLNVRADYNQSKIRETDNINDLLNISVLCYNDSDRRIVNEMFEHWFSAHKNNTYDENNVNELFKELTTLNAMEGGNNASSLSVGAKWLVQLALGNDLRRVIKDYLQVTYRPEELYKYFVQEDLNRSKWTLRKDNVLDLNCLKSNLEVIVFMYGQLEQVCLKDVNKDIFKSFDTEICYTKSK